MASLSNQRARAALVTSVVATVALYFIPLGSTLAYPLVLLSTLAHEMGHGIAALLVGCRFDAFMLYSDGSGAALTAGNPGRLASAFISAGGLVGPAIASSICFLVGRRAQAARTTLLVVGVLLVIALILLIRNVFGWVFVAAVATICIWGGLKAAKDVAQLMIIFVGVQLALSVFSRSDYLFTATARTGMGAAPSDVAQMADALFLPYWFWGIACGGFSVFVLFHGLRRFINDTK